MKTFLRQLRDDEQGFIISAEAAIMTTVGTLAMVVGLEAVSSAVINELNDLAQAFGAIDQSYSYNAIAKVRHARMAGSGFFDRRDFCDCSTITHSDVGGITESAGSSEVVSMPVQTQSVVAPQIIREEVIREEVIDTPKVVVERAPCPVSDGEIIEERIIRRRVNSLSDCCDTSAVTVIPEPQPKAKGTIKSDRTKKPPTPAKSK